MVVAWYMNSQSSDLLKHLSDILEQFLLTSWIGFTQITTVLEALILIISVLCVLHTSLFLVVCFLGLI